MTFHSLRFDRAASTYEAHAQVQADMARTLIGLLPAAMQGGPLSGPILEMGCGTGLLTRRIRERFPEAALVATDASPRMLETARAWIAPSHSGIASTPERRSVPAEEPAPPEAKRGSPIHWSLFDASGETPPSEPVSGASPYALAASGALVQWFPRLERHFAMVASLLGPGGYYLVSGFARDNFPELNAILADPPFVYPEYPGHSAKAIREAAASAGFRVDAYREESIATVLPTPQAFLESIRGLGSARRPETEKPLTRSRLRLLVSGYQERYACPGGVKATWKPWYARLRQAESPRRT